MDYSIEQYHLKSSSLFDFLTKEEVARIKDKQQQKEYRKGEYLFKEQSNPRGIYIVRKGKIKIFQMNNDGKQSIVYIYRRGDYFGYRPILANEPHPVSAVAMENVLVTFIPREVFLDMVKSPALAKELLFTLSKEFSVWINKMTVFSQYSVKKRVALALLILNNIYKQHEDKVVQILIKRDDFASFVGVAKETLVRMLRIFKDEELIKTEGSKIQLLNPGGLIQLIQET